MKERESHQAIGWSFTVGVSSLVALLSRITVLLFVSCFASALGGPWCVFTFCFGHIRPPVCIFFLFWPYKAPCVQVTLLQIVVLNGTFFFFQSFGCLGVKWCRTSIHTLYVNGITNLTCNIDLFVEILCLGRDLLLPSADSSTLIDLCLESGTSGYPILLLEDEDSCWG